MFTKVHWRFSARNSPNVQLSNCNLQLLFLQVIKIIPDGSLIRPRNLVLVQRALRIGLRGGSGFLVGDGALPFDAQALQRDAWHRAAGVHLAAHFGWGQVRVEVLGAFGLAPRVHVGASDAGVVILLRFVRKIGPARFISPSAHPAAGFAAGFKRWTALALAP